LSCESGLWRKIERGERFGEFDQVQRLDGELRLLHAAAPDPESVGYEVRPQHERDFRAKLLREVAQEDEYDSLGSCGRFPVVAEVMEAKSALD